MATISGTSFSLLIHCALSDAVLERPADARNKRQSVAGARVMPSIILTCNSNSLLTSAASNTRIISPTYSSFVKGIFQVVTAETPPVIITLSSVVNNSRPVDDSMLIVTGVTPSPFLLNTQYFNITVSYIVAA